MWVCETTGPNGAPALTRYSEFKSVEASLSHYEQKRRGTGLSSDVKARDGSIARRVWLYPGADAEGAYVASTAYVDHPFSMSVEAASTADRDWILSHRVRFRSPEHFSGRP